MNKILIALCFACFIAGCKKDTPLKVSEPIKPDYTLPQGKSPADNRIVDLYNKYNTYFLYEYTETDFGWNQIGKRESAFHATKADPRFVGDILDLLQDKWFRFYPDEFLKDRMPYKIFLADSLYIEFDPMSKFLTYVHPGAENLALGYVNDQLRGRNAAFKNNYKIRLNYIFLEMLINKKSIELPAAFFVQSDYTRNTLANNLASPDYFKARGFVQNYPSLEYTPVEGNKKDDVISFIKTMVSLKKMEWDRQFLNYPLLKNKYDILQTYFLTKYNVNLQQIGDSE